MLRLSPVGTSYTPVSTVPSLDDDDDDGDAVGGVRICGQTE
jgi:hypothetical protein